MLQRLYDLAQTENQASEEAAVGKGNPLKLYESQGSHL